MNCLTPWTLESYHGRNLPELSLGVSFFPMKRFCVHPLALTAALSFAVSAQAQQDTQQVEARVNGILAQMTLAEKLDYISGEPLPTNLADLMGVFDIKPIPRLGVPKIIGNDGTIGITAQGLPAGTIRSR
jgi:hypothetical protein